jgi:hypothetical protein
MEPFRLRIVTGHTNVRQLTSKRKNSLLCPRRKATFVPKDYRDFYAALTAKNLRLCPECGIGIMIRIEILPPCHCLRMDSS